MKIVFVRPNVNNRFMIIPPLGLGYLAAAAKKAGHEVSIYDAYLYNTAPSRAIIEVALKNPDVVGIQVYYNTIEWTREFIFLAKHLAIASHIKNIIVGGPQITAFPELAKELGADEGISGEGEYLWFGSQPFDVNSIPMPDWDSFDLPAYWKYMNTATMPIKGKRPVNIQRTRGCPFKCTFCAGHITHGYKVRIREDDNVIAEIEYLKNKWNIDEVWFQDDNVILNYRRGIELWERLESLNIHIRLPNGIRYENVSNEMAYKMERAGVYFTGLGIESGHPRVLKRIKKSLNQQQMRNAIIKLERVGILTSGFFILGLPTETREEMEYTVLWALSTYLHYAQFGLFIPYPGSEDYNKKSLLSHNELVNISRNATLRFYLRPRIIWGLIKHFKWSQVKAIFNHRWIKEWLKFEI